MPVERNEHSTVIAGPAVRGAQAVTLLHAIRLYIQAGIIPTRGFGPKRMRDLATKFTNRTYARSRKGLVRALEDLEAVTAGKTLDEVGERYDKQSHLKLHDD